MRFRSEDNEYQLFTENKLSPDFDTRFMLTILEEKIVVIKTKISEISWKVKSRIRK